MGCADRSAYDLTVHSKHTDKPLLVRQRLDEPRIVQEWQAEIDKKKFGPLFKKDSKAVEAAILATTQEQRETMAKEIQDGGKTTVDVPELGKVDIAKGLVTVEYRTRTDYVREYTPNVIEPSFGIGRILYALCEHNYWTRASEGGDEARSVSVLCADFLSTITKLTRLLPV